MPASRSPRPSSSSPPDAARRRYYGVPIAIGVVALLAALVMALPASLAGRILPPWVRATDFSGTIWHGAAGKISLNGHDAGALEWHLHADELLGLRAGLDLNWALRDFSLVARGRITPRGFAAGPISGGGTLEDLATLTGMPGWHGNVAVSVQQLTTDFGRLSALSGDIRVTDLHAANVGDDVNLGGYTLHFDDHAADRAGVITGLISDDGGPLQVHATLTLAPQDHTGSLAGTAIERASATPALRKSLEDLAQMSMRDSQGRIPLEIEFSY
ncbi:MAG: type II secretion system protein N [Steroidobacterales bacterium]